MEMSFARCLPCTPEKGRKRRGKGEEKERDGGLFGFLMSLRAEVCHCIDSVGKVSQRISRISVSFCKRCQLYQSTQQSRERAPQHLSYNLWHEGWKCMLDDCRARSSSIYASHRKDASLCVMSSKALNDESPFFSVSFILRCMRGFVMFLLKCLNLDDS